MKKKLKVFSLIVFLGLISKIDANMGNAVYAEAGGSGIVYSVNYERIIKAFDDNNSLEFRIGFTALPMNPNEVRLSDDELLFINSRLITPIGLLYSFGGKKGRIEIGTIIGPHFLIGDEDRATLVFLDQTFGYKLRPIEKRIFFRINLNLSINIKDMDVLPWPAISIGTQF